MLPQTQTQQPPPMSLEQYQKTAVNMIENVCGIICMPIELFLRPFYGTRYFPLAVSFFSMILMVFLPSCPRPQDPSVEWCRLAIRRLSQVSSVLALSPISISSSWPFTVSASGAA